MTTSAAAHDKILLHTWSLSVEWQFYIILPIILVVIGKIKKSRSILNLAVLMGLVVSLALSYKVSQTSQTTAFYMIPTRAWEMLAGGLVYSYFSQISLSSIVKKGIEVLGFLLILISLIIFETDTLWPSINALLPVLGSMLILTEIIMTQYLQPKNISMGRQYIVFNLSMALANRIFHWLFRASAKYFSNYFRNYTFFNTRVVWVCLLRRVSKQNFSIEKL